MTAPTMKPAAPSNYQLISKPGELPTYRAIHQSGGKWMKPIGATMPAGPWPKHAGGEEASEGGGT